MPGPDKPMTHIAWAQYYEHGKFREWVEIGRGRIDSEGGIHIHNNRIALGGSSYILMLPVGSRPKDPTPTPHRPQSGEEKENT